jgi:hypothetical protein
MFFKQGVKLERIVDRLFYTHIGSIAVSAIFGVALAIMFQRVCKDRKCIVIQAPPMKEIAEHYYKVGDDCYKYTPSVVKCVKDDA